MKNNTIDQFHTSTDRNLLPFSRAFCDWGQTTQSNVNSFSAEHLGRGLQWIAGLGISYIHAADDDVGTHALKQLSLAGPAAQRICAVREFA